MDEPSLPRNPELLARRLCDLRDDRRERHALRRRKPVRRQALSSKHRAVVPAKTAGRCHLCGGTVVDQWAADHVLAHADSGPHAIDNYLPAHVLCNGYRWSYSPEEFQWMLKIGVWARLRMEKRSDLGTTMLREFFDYERRRLARRRVRRVRHATARSTSRTLPRSR